MALKAIDKDAPRSIPLHTSSLMWQWARSNARPMAEECLSHPKQANIFSLKSIKPLINFLWREDKMFSKKVALSTVICFLSGCRMKEALEIVIEDMRIKTNREEGITFLIFPVRVSKTNPFGEKREELIIPLAKNPVFDVMSMINEVKGYRSYGRLFENNPGLTTQKTSYHLMRGSKAIGLSLAPSGHSGRVSMLLTLIKNGVSESSIKTHMRWKTDTGMINYYKSLNLETHPISAPFQLWQNNFFSF